MSDKSMEPTTNMAQEPAAHDEVVETIEQDAMIGK